MKIAILSNINMDATIRLLKRDVEVYETEGYGNEIGMLLKPNSSLKLFSPSIVFVIEDLMEVIEHNLEKSCAKNKINQWFEAIEHGIDTERIFYISDTFLWGIETSVLINTGIKVYLENYWQEKLEQLMIKKSNVRIFGYRNIIERMGSNNAFSYKMWYMGKILHSIAMQKNLAEEVVSVVHKETFTPKKVLLLDLDNTLWGGLAGENDITPIELSEDHNGLAYKNLQRIILQMKKQGVLLGIVSKNNETDAMEIIERHPHMILRNEDFVCKKINWRTKPENIKEIANQLNLGLDSFVFFDDNPAERQIVKELLPEVHVADFPDKVELLPETMVAIWKKYFDRSIIIDEDVKKTKQYIENVDRENYRISVGNYDEYLKGLEIRLIRKNESKYLERITQLLNKTNQFNLTTKRYTLAEIQDIANDPKEKIFAYQVVDRFGDNGIIAVAIVSGDKTPCIRDLVMSCRVMGREIENAILDDIENELAGMGFEKIYAEYVQTSKNTPVENLYDNLGYSRKENANGHRVYELELSLKQKRSYQLELIDERT